MKSEKRHVVESKKTTVYIAEDGTEFENESNCKDYEAELEAIRRGIPRVKAVDVDDDYFWSGTMWYFASKEDFDWLISDYCYNGVICGNGRKFYGTGWYMVRFVECFDSPDEWHIEYIDNKIKSLEKRISNLQKLQAGECELINIEKPKYEYPYYRCT